MKTQKLFLDDLRVPEQIFPVQEAGDFIVVRSCQDFVDHIQRHGLPAFISFDNDLGADETGQILPDGYAAAKWLVYESGLDLRHLKFHVHSANPVASVSIRALLDNYIRFQQAQI